MNAQDALDCLEVAEDCALESNLGGKEAIARLRKRIRRMPQALAERETHLTSVYREEIASLTRQNREPEPEFLND